MVRPADQEKTTILKRACDSQSPRGTQGHTGKPRVGQEAGDKQELWAGAAGLASLDNSTRLWGSKAVPSSLVPGPG